MKALVAILITVLISQFMKVLHHYNEHKQLDWRIFFADGGMPSSHTALVVSLVMVILFETGFSLLFVAVLVFALITMNDAMRVRYETGQEAKAINLLVRKNKVKFVRLNEQEGHTFVQVAVGTILGLLIPYIVYALW